MGNNPSSKGKSDPAENGKLHQYDLIQGNITVYIGPMQWKSDVFS